MPCRKSPHSQRISDLFPIFAKKWFAFSLVLDITLETNTLCSVPLNLAKPEAGCALVG